jgi:ribose transport system ATP-binding protein
VLVLDEPTSSLTSQDVERLFAVLARLKAEGHAIVYISHFLEEVKRLADQITVLRDGRVAGSAPAAELSPEALVRLMVGRELQELYPRSARTPSEAILRVDGLAGQGGPVAASLDLHRGEVLGIFGLVGAGRTELLRTIFGLQAVRAGEVRLGVHVGPASPARRWAQGAGFLSENRATEGLALGLSVADNLTATRLPGLVSPRRQEAAAARWIGELDIRGQGPRQRAEALSGGNQQKVALGRLLHHDVDVLLLDEPTRGIDVGSKAHIYQLIDRLASGAGERPRAVLMVSSYLPELLGVCDRVAVMCRGRLGPVQPVAEVTAEELLRQATGQEAAS